MAKPKWKQLSLFGNLSLNTGKKKKSSTPPYIKRRAELWAKLQASARKYEDNVYNQLLNKAKTIQPQLAWDKLSREDFFTTFLKWNNNNKNLSFQALPSYPTGFVGNATNMPAVPRSQIQTKIQLDATRAKAVDMVYARQGTFGQQLGYYAEQEAEDVLKASMNQVFQHPTTQKAGVGGQVYTVGSQAVDTRVSVWWTGPAGFVTSPNSINLDHKMNMNSFSVTQGDTKTIAVSPKYYSSIPYNKMGPELKKAVMVEILYDKYMTTQPFFYSSNNVGHILTPTKFFEQQKNFTLLSGDIEEVTQSFIDKETEERLDLELILLNDPTLTKEDLKKSPRGEEIIKEVLEETQAKLVIANYSVHYK